MSRETVRKAFATLLESGVTQAQDVYPYQVGDFNGQSPVLVVTSGGTERRNLTLRNRIPKYWFDIHVFVLYAEPDASWGEDDAEDALDNIEQAIATIIDANQQTANWSKIDYDGRSKADSLVIAGTEYRHEVIPVVVEVLN
jgi:hypothetical protein